MKLYTVAILGATGAVGQEMIKILQERNFPVYPQVTVLKSIRNYGLKAFPSRGFLPFSLTHLRKTARKTRMVK